MADQKISELTALTGANAADDDALAIVDTSSVETKKITRSELFTDTPTLLVGMTTDGVTSTGVGLVPDGINHMYSAGDGTNATLMLGRGGDDGNILSLNRSGATVGSISSRSGNAIVIASQGKSGINFGGTSINPWLNGSITDDTVDFGQSAHRFKDIYLSGGVVLDDNPTAVGGDVTSKTLDDYEEGTFTPVLSFDGGTTGITYNNRGGRYTKVGNMVTVWIHFYLANKGSSSGQARIGGLPYTVTQPSGTYNVFAPMGDRGNLNTSGRIVSAYISTGNDYFPLYSGGFDGSANTQVSQSMFENITEINIQLSYPAS